DHVVAPARRERGEVGVEREPAVALEAHEAPRAWHDDEQAPVREPAEARGAVGDVADRLRAAGLRIDADDAVVAHVGAVEESLAPARALEEGESIGGEALGAPAGPAPGGALSPPGPRARPR